MQKLPLFTQNSGDFSIRAQLFSGVARVHSLVIKSEHLRIMWVFNPLVSVTYIYV